LASFLNSEPGLLESRNTRNDTKEKSSPSVHPFRAVPISWLTLRHRAFAVNALQTVERLAAEIGVADRLHLWPDN